MGINGTNSDSPSDASPRDVGFEGRVWHLRFPLIVDAAA